MVVVVADVVVVVVVVVAVVVVGVVVVHCPLSILHSPLSIVLCPLSVVLCPLSIKYKYTCEYKYTLSTGRNRIRYERGGTQIIWHGCTALHKYLDSLLRFFNFLPPR